MALLNGQTPEEIASAIVNVEPVMIEIDGAIHAELVKIARYNQRDFINVRGENAWNKEADRYVMEALNKLIQDKAKALTSYTSKKSEAESMKYFRYLRSKGMSVEQAAETARVTL